MNIENDIKKLEKEYFKAGELRCALIAGELKILKLWKADREKIIREFDRQMLFKKINVADIREITNKVKEAMK